MSADREIYKILELYNKLKAGHLSKEESGLTQAEIKKLSTSITKSICGIKQVAYHEEFPNLVVDSALFGKLDSLVARHEKYDYLEGDLL